MWPGTPIVFCCTNKGILVSHPSSRTTGVSVDLDWRGNLRLARQLFPATQHVVLVGGATEEDHRLNDPLSQVIRQDDPAMELIDLTNLPLSEQLARVKVLPSQYSHHVRSPPRRRHRQYFNSHSGRLSGETRPRSRCTDLFHTQHTRPHRRTRGLHGRDGRVGKRGGSTWTLGSLRQDAAGCSAIALSSHFICTSIGDRYGAGRYPRPAFQRMR